MTLFLPDLRKLFLPLTCTGGLGLFSASAQPLFLNGGLNPIGGEWIEPRPAFFNPGVTEWKGTGDGIRWSDAANWSNGVPVDGMKIVLGNSSRNNLSDPVVTPGIILVPVLESAQQISGNTLRVGSFGIANFGQPNSIIRNNVEFVESSRIHGNTGQIFTGNLVLSQGGDLSEVAITGNTYLKGQIGENGEGRLKVKTGGNVILAGNNSYSGGTILEGGVLSVSSDANLGSEAGALTFSGGRLLTTGEIVSSRSISVQGYGNVLQQGANSVTWNGNLNGTGTLTKIGTGDLILGGNNSSEASIRVVQGRLVGNSSSMAKNIQNHSSVVFNQAANGGYQGVITGNGSLTKTGAGVLTLEKENTYSGNTIVKNGTLSVSAERNLGVLPPEAPVDAPTLPPNMAYATATIRNWTSYSLGGSLSFSARAF